MAFDTAALKKSLWETLHGHLHLVYEPSDHEAICKHAQLQAIEEYEEKCDIPIYEKNDILECQASR